MVDFFFSSASFTCAEFLPSSILFSFSQIPGILPALMAIFCGHQKASPSYLHGHLPPIPITFRSLTHDREHADISSFGEKATFSPQDVLLPLRHLFNFHLSTFSQAIEIAVQKRLLLQQRADSPVFSAPTTLSLQAHGNYAGLPSPVAGGLIAPKDKRKPPPRYLLGFSPLKSFSPPPLLDAAKRLAISSQEHLSHVPSFTMRELTPIIFLRLLRPRMR